MCNGSFRGEEREKKKKILGGNKNQKFLKFDVNHYTSKKLKELQVG